MRKIARDSGGKRTLLAIVALVVLTTGHLLFAPTLPQEASTVCSSTFESAAGAPESCIAEQEPARLPARVPAREDVLGFAGSTKPAPERTEYAKLNGPGADAEDFFPAEQLRPRYTIAELCQQGAISSGWSCRIDRAGEKSDFSGRSESGEGFVGRSISGYVLSAEGPGLGRLTIVATPTRLKNSAPNDGTRLRFRTMTDSFGAYIFEGLPDGEYTIRSSARGDYPSARISARAGVNFADLVIARNSPTVLSGQVVSDTGETLEGVTVVPTTLGQASVITNVFGWFRLPVSVGPTAGEVTLRFQRPGYQEQVAGVALRPDTNAQANELTVIMPPVESWTSLQGTITSQSGEPLAGRTVELRPRSTKLAYTATTDSDGEYDFPVVESPADYRVIVFGGAGHKDYQESLRITANTSRLDVVVEPYEFGEVSGQLVNVHGEPVPEFDLVLRNTASRRPNNIVTTDEYGNFEVPSVPAGNLVVASQSTPSILVQGLQLGAGESLRLPLVLDWGKHEIRGIVVDARGNPVPASRILLQWSHREGGVTTRATRRTASDTQGQFAFSNLGPGPHSLQVNAQGFPRVDLEHDLSRQGYDLTVRLN